MKKLMLYIIATMGLALMIIQPVTGAGTVPILQPKETTNTFTPTAVGKKSYYIVQPNSNIPTSMYSGSVPGTFTGTSISSEGYGKLTNLYLNNAVIPSSYSSAYSIFSANNFVNEPFPVANAVQIDNTNSTLVYKDTTPFSIHIDQSLTFFGENGKSYYAVLDQSGNLVLDIDVKDSSASATVFVYSNNHLILSRTVSRASIPVLANTGSYVFVIQVNGADSLITIAPHTLNSNQLTTQSVDVNDSSKLTVSQGECYTSGNNQVSGSQNLVTKFNLFNLPVQSNSYYSIYVDVQNLDNYNYGCINYGSILPYLLNKTNDGSNSDPITSMTNAQVISGSLDSNSLTLRAINSGNLQLVLESIGHLNDDITIFFRQITPPKPQTQELPVAINTASRLYTNTYNTFTVPQNSVLAVNYTGTGNAETLSFYSFNSSYNVWNFNYDFSQTVNGNLLTTNANTISSGDWMYLPSGTYAVKTSETSSNVKFTINIIPITILNDATSKTVQINNQSVYAFEPTVTNYIQLQFLNLTSQTHDNISVSYEFAIIGKYNEAVLSAPYYVTNPSSFIGNKLVTGGWQAFDSNDTNIFVNDKFADIIAPIVIIHPVGAKNITNSLTAYSTQLKVTTKLFTQNNYGQIERFNVPAVTSKTTFNSKNDGFSNTPTLAYRIPLVTDTNSLYNVTISATGNFSSTLSRNLTVSYVQITGGKYLILDTNLNDISFNNDTTSLMSQLILTQSNPSYLYLEISRSFSSGYLNGTITIQLTKLSVNSLNFPNAVYNNYNSLTWNKSISAYEVADNSILFSVVTPGGSTPGFEIFIAIIGLGLLPIAKKFKNKYRN